MIVCICANVSENEIKALLPADILEVMAKTNAALTCGICYSHLEEIVNSTTEDPGLPSFNNP